MMLLELHRYRFLVKIHLGRLVWPNHELDSADLVALETLQPTRHSSESSREDFDAVGLYEVIR